MNSLKLATKIAESRLDITLLYGVPFGCITYFATPAHTKRFLAPSIVSGLLFGVLSSIFQQKRMKKNLQFAKSNTTSKNKIFDIYLKDNVVPTTKSEQKALNNYMDIIEKNQLAVVARYYPKRYSKYLTYAIFLVLFLITLSLHYLRFLSVVYPVIILIGLYNEYKNKLLRHRIAAMRNKLNNGI